MSDLRILQLWIQTLLSSRMWRRVVYSKFTNIPKDPPASYCCVKQFYPEERKSRFLWNVSIVTCRPIAREPVDEHISL
jgi:hypothetical protein